MSKLKGSLLGILAALLLSACVSTPLTVSKKVDGYSQAQIERAILESGKIRGWKMTKQKDGLIAASINVKGNKANVKIPYGPNHYSVDYVSSTRVDGSTKPPTNYGRWAVKLSRDIEAKLLESK